MFNFKIIGLFLLFTFSSLNPSFASSEDFKSFLKSTSESCTSFDYEFEMEGDVLITGSGSLVFQDNCFIMKGNGLELYCDGTARWNVDKAAAEVVIEGISPAESNGSTNFEQYDFFSNPSLIFLYLSKNLDEDEYQMSRVKFDGELMEECSIKPSIDCGLQLIKLYFDGKTLKGASLIVDDGTKTDFKISNLEFHKKKSPSYFRLDETKLDSNYYITDLR